jgi:hypothetical protein
MAVDTDVLVVDEPGHEVCTSQPDGREEDGAPVTVDLIHAADTQLLHLVL